MAGHGKINPNRSLSPLLLLEQAQLLRYAHFSVLCENTSLPEDLLSEQLTILSDIRQETEKRIGNSGAEASNEEVQQLFKRFPKEP